MSPAPRAAYALAAVAASAVVVPLPIAALAALALLAATAVDLRAVRRPPAVSRRLPAVAGRGVPSQVEITAEGPAARRLRLRQATPPDLRLSPKEGEGRLESTLVAIRRGRHRLPAVAVRCEGPLGLGRWHHSPGEEAEIHVYPDLAAARRLVVAMRQGRRREEGLRSRGPLGLGTEFESVRDYLPDDDIRQVNWRATARLGRPMSNQYRIEQDRDVVCVVDAGRLMRAPTTAPGGADQEGTRLDAAVDAVAAVGLVADELGDRFGIVAFDSEVRRELRPRRAGGAAAVRALFDLEPAAVEADYELAFRRVESTKRAFVLVLTDLLEEVAARPLVQSVPVLARRHAVVVAGVADPELERATRTPPDRPFDLYTAAAALDVLDARARVARALRASGAGVVEAPAEGLGPACVRAYLRAKARARL